MGCLPEGLWMDWMMWVEPALSVLLVDVAGGGVGGGGGVLAGGGAVDEAGDGDEVAVAVVGVVEEVGGAVGVDHVGERGPASRLKVRPMPACGAADAHGGEGDRVAVGVDDLGQVQVVGVDMVDLDVLGGGFADLHQALAVAGGVGQFGLAEVEPGAIGEGER